MTNTLFFLGFEKEHTLLSKMISGIESSECSDNVFVVSSPLFMPEYDNICNNNIIDYSAIKLYAEFEDILIVHDIRVLSFLEEISFVSVKLKLVIINSSIDIGEIIEKNTNFISIISIYLPLFNVANNAGFVLKNIMLKYDINEYLSKSEIGYTDYLDCSFFKCFADYYIVYDAKSADFLYLAFEIIPLFMIFLLHQISSFFAEVSYLDQEYLEKLVAKDILTAFNCYINYDDLEGKSGFVEIVTLNLFSFIRELEAINLESSIIEEVINIISNILYSIFGTDEPVAYLGYIIDSNKRLAMLLDELQKIFIQDKGIINYVYNNIIRDKSNINGFRE